MERVKQMLSPRWVGLVQSDENPNRAKRLDLTVSQGELLLTDFFQAKTLILTPLVSDSGWNLLHRLSGVSSLPTGDLGTCTGSVSLENPD